MAKRLKLKMDRIDDSTAKVIVANDRISVVTDTIEWARKNLSQMEKVHIYLTNGFIQCYTGTFFPKANDFDGHALSE